MFFPNQNSNVEVFYVGASGSWYVGIMQPLGHTKCNIFLCIYNCYMLLKEIETGYKVIECV